MDGFKQSKVLACLWLVMVHNVRTSCVVKKTRFLGVTFYVVDELLLLLVNTSQYD